MVSLFSISADIDCGPIEVHKGRAARAIPPMQNRQLQSTKEDTVENFINFSNHKSTSWSAEQTDAAKSLAHGGCIIDVPFPNVPPSASEEEVAEMAKDAFATIWDAKPAVVMVMGEFSLSHKVTERLKGNYITVVVATTEREVVEKTNEKGETVKVSSFKFVKFRKV